MLIIHNFRVFFSSNAYVIFNIFEVNVVSVLKCLLCFSERKWGSSNSFYCALCVRVHVNMDETVWQ